MSHPTSTVEIPLVIASLQPQMTPLSTQQAQQRPPLVARGQVSCPGRPLADQAGPRRYGRGVPLLGIVALLAAVSTTPAPLLSSRSCRRRTSHWHSLPGLS
ncbi:uncharacterized protein PV06_08673 [Exophiala oligosperma]|uniref:Uncharacterized protein n=1 Tax=Exophiala oligosperma TaxID=215243 RepID=A0A0D2DTA7_9EURO|nr:uncharacterized protein PV06_08673 [Exophiala oligosperma]KIW38839.1 hypothetical protein PV06_08673 [Exophiala oligosperma]